jgi:hypothetical protein
MHVSFGREPALIPAAVAIVAMISLCVKKAGIAIFGRGFVRF